MIIHSGQDINLSNANETKCKPKLVNIEVQENVYAYVIGFEDEGATDLRFWRGDSNTLWNCSVVLNYEDYGSCSSGISCSDENLFLFLRRSRHAPDRETVCP